MRKNSIDKIVNRRYSVLYFVIIVLFFVLFIKLFMVMVIDKNKYSNILADLTSNKITLSSAPRGRIFDRNHKILVDNKAVNTIVYKKEKDASNEDMIKLAYIVAPHLKLDVSKLTLRGKKEFYLAKYPDRCEKKITDEEWEKLEQRKLTNRDIEELKIERITIDELSEFNDEDLKVSYLFYLMRKGYAYEAKVIRYEASAKEFAYIAENIDKLEGFSTRVDWERVYPYGDTLRTILGTVSTSSQGIPAEKKDYYLSKGYSLNDRVGLSYLELQYEDYLRGEKAVYEQISSNELKLVKEGSRGKDIVLSIDIDLQREVEEILDDQIEKTKREPNTKYYDHSAVVIQNPFTGEILVMASRKLVGKKIVDNISSILVQPITPGSIVKGASMLVGYETGAIKHGEKILDQCIHIRGMKDKCSSVLTLGTINDITALAKSSNVYQFKIAIRVNGQEYYPGMTLKFKQSSFDTYRKMYHAFGLGVKTGIDLPTESSGYSAKDHAAGNLLDFVMGQYETYTPMQLSQYISAIANNGKRIQPHLLKEVHEATDTNELGELLFKVEPVVLNEVGVKKSNLERVQEGFYAVTHASGAYGLGYMHKRMDASGKTGTSQSFIDDDGDGVIDTETITTSFIGYAPSNKPKFSIVVTSPNASYPNNRSLYDSPVTRRITKEVTDAYYDKYGI